MSNVAPRMVILAGPNGAGKSTFASRLLPARYGSPPFLNADDIARGLSPPEPEGVAAEAGRIMLERLRELIKQRVSFALETTLASRSLVSHINEAHQRGYEVQLYFLMLAAPELSVARVRQRVSAGGHDIPEDTVRRRFQRGRHNFLELYRPLADRWYVYDNSDYDNPSKVAAGSGVRLLRTFRSEEWQQLCEGRNER